MSYASNYTENAESRRKNWRLCSSDDATANRRSLQGARCHGNGGSRSVFTRAQLDAMEDRFARQSFLTREERIELAAQLQLTERQVLVWFQNRRGRLKRKGPADKAYERKRYYDSLGPDARGRSLLAGITWAAGHSARVAFSDAHDTMNSTRKTDSERGFEQPLSGSVCTTWNELPEEDDGKVSEGCHTAIADDRIYRLQNRPIDAAASETGGMSVDVRQTSHAVNTSVFDDGNYGFVRFRSTAQQHLPRSLQDGGNATTACVWERGQTPWNAEARPHRSEQLVVCRSDVHQANGCGQLTSTYCWPVASRTVQPVHLLELLPSFRPCRSAAFENTGWSCSSTTDCWSGFETSLFSNNCDSASSVDRCPLNSNYY